MISQKLPLSVQRYAQRIEAEALPADFLAELASAYSALMWQECRVLR